MSALQVVIQCQETYGFVLRQLKPESVKVNLLRSAEWMQVKHIAGSIYLVPWQQNRYLNSRNTRLARCGVLHRSSGAVCICILCVSLSPVWGPKEYMTADFLKRHPSHISRITQHFINIFSANRDMTHCITNIYTAE